MTKEEKKIVWDYIIKLSLTCASKSEGNLFDIVEESKKEVEIPEILK